MADPGGRKLGMGDLRICATLATVGLLVLGLSGCPLIPQQDSDPSEEEPLTVVPESGPKDATPAEPDRGGGELDPDILSKLKDAVVLIEVRLNTVLVEGGGTGSGFFTSADGHLVTNHHVIAKVAQRWDQPPAVARDREIRVVLHPGTENERTLPAEIVRENPELDLAVLRIAEAPGAFLELADSEAASETSRVFVCGHPLGMREFSIRSGTVTAHRVFNGHDYIEHDAMAEGGNSGGPVVDSRGEVVGIHSRSYGAQYDRLTKFAIPSNVLDTWLQADPANDPKEIILGEPDHPVRMLLEATGLPFHEPSPGVYAVEYDNGVTLTVVMVRDFFSVSCALGDLPGDNAEDQAEWALDALEFGFADPIGHIYISSDDESPPRIGWAAAAPMSDVTAEFAKQITDTACVQVERWRQMVAGEVPRDPLYLFPTVDDESDADELWRIVRSTTLPSSRSEGLITFTTVDGWKMYAGTFHGMAYIHAYVGGMPELEADDPSARHAAAIDILKRNRRDLFGRFVLDTDHDVRWEAQVPIEFLTGDYVTVVVGACTDAVRAYRETYGEVPFFGETS